MGKGVFIFTYVLITQYKTRILSTLVSFFNELIPIFIRKEGPKNLYLVRVFLAETDMHMVHDLGVEGVALASLAKERDDESPSPRVKRHGGVKREKLFLEGVKDPLLPPPDAPAFLFLQRIRDESHRFAIRYHRELRRKAGLRSILDELPGIGPGKRRSLLSVLGSLEGVKQASVEELTRVPKVSVKDAELIYGFFHAEADGEPVKQADESSDPVTS